MAKKNFYYVIPLLTLLSVSPAKLLKNKPLRSIASVEVVEEKEEVKEEKKFPLFLELTSRIDPSNLLVVESITKESLKEKALTLSSQIQTESEKFNKDASDSIEIKIQRDLVESLVVDAVIFDKEVSVLDDKKELDEELKKEMLLAGDSHKEALELLIGQLIVNENREIEPPKLADEEKVEEKKEEKEEDSKLAEDKKEDKDEKKEDKKDEICEASEQVKVLTAQVEKLMSDQSLILQTMANLAQAMANMTQNMQSQTPYFPMPQTAYQYHAPMAQGNWVYYPQGFNQQPNMNQGFYPNQAFQPQMQQPMQAPQGQMQNNWNLAPQQNFQFQQTPMPQVGQFGMGEQTPAPMFNLSHSPVIGMF